MPPRPLLLLLLLCLLRCPGAARAALPQEDDQRDEFDLQGSIIINQIAISQMLEEHQSLAEGITRVETKLQNLTETISSYLTLGPKSSQDALERDNVTRRVLDKLHHLETRNLTLACDIELRETSEIQELQRENTQLQEDNLKVKEETQEVEEENRKLRDDLRQVEDENRQKKIEIRQHEEDALLLQERTRVLEQTTAAAVHAKNETTRIIAELERKNEQQERVHKITVEAKNLLEEKVAIVEKENRKLEERNTILEEEKIEREEENSRVEAEKSEVEEKNRLMEEENLKCERNVMELSTRMVSARDCAELYCAGIRKDGVYTISPGRGRRLVSVWCDMSSAGGGWTVFLLRQQQTPEENFRRDWEEYKQGFGILWSEHWMGTEALHQLTSWKPHVLRVEATNLEDDLHWAQWSIFSVDSEDTSYRLEIGDYDESSSLGDSLVGNHNLNNSKFSTMDRDNDDSPLRDCVQSFSVGGGWWYNNCAYMTPTGPHTGSGKHMLAFWTPDVKTWVSLNRLQMMVRSRDFPDCGN